MDSYQRSGMGFQRKVCVADGDLCDLECIARWLYEAGYSVCTFQTGQDLVRKLEEGNACCVVADASLPDLSPTALSRWISSRKCHLPVVFIGSGPTISTIVQAMKEGAIDFLEKPLAEQPLLAAVAAATVRHDQDLLARDASRRIQNRYETLTGPEQEIFKFVVTGMLNKQVASELGISEKTVKVHRGRVMKKLEVQSVAELVRLSEKLIAVLKASVSSETAIDREPLLQRAQELTSTNGS